MWRDYFKIKVLNFNGKVSSEMLGSKILGIPMSDFTGKKVGHICDLILDDVNYKLKFIVISKTYISLLNVGFFRKIIPVEYVSVIGRNFIMRLTLEHLKLVHFTSLKFKSLDIIDKMLLKKDIPAMLILTFPLILIIIGILCRPTIYGGLAFFFGGILSVYMPLLIPEIQYVRLPGLSLRYIYKLNVYDSHEILIGMGEDLYLDIQNRKAKALVVKPPDRPVKFKEQINKLYGKKKHIAISMNPVQVIRDNSVILKTSFHELHKIIH